MSPSTLKIMQENTTQVGVPFCVQKFQIEVWQLGFSVFFTLVLGPFVIGLPFSYLFSSLGLAQPQKIYTSQVYWYPRAFVTVKRSSFPSGGLNEVGGYW